MHQKTEPPVANWLDKPIYANAPIKRDTAIFIAILLLAILTRFYHLGDRVMSHDETSHVYYAWRLYKGMGYQHTPITHGPFQFHIVALSYFFFGDNDFTARIPSAIFSILTIAFVWKYRNYLGKTGTIISSLLMLISPYMLYYGRYVRNEAFVGLFGLVTFWSVLKYLEGGGNKYLYFLTAATVLHFTTKETAFIYTAQVLIFVGIIFVFDLLLKASWQRESRKRLFIFLIIAAILVFSMGTVLSQIISGETQQTIATEVREGLEESNGVTPPSLLSVVPIAITGLLLLIALILAIGDLKWVHLKSNRPLSIIILLLTLVLPQLAPFPVQIFGWDPTDYSSSGMIRTAIFIIPLALLSILIGLAWNPRVWLINAGIFYIPFTVLYTTIFTNGSGFFTGLVGSLGYWLQQQGVKRGNQPWYYYLFVQIPIYEYLPAIGTILAFVYSLKLPPKTKETNPSENSQDYFVPMMAFWVITSAIAYTIAGEKMPWLTYHIALPMILFAGWAVGKLFDSIEWDKIIKSKAWIALLLLLMGFLSAIKAIALLLGETPPFQGKELEQLSATSSFILATTIAILCIGISRKLMRLVDLGTVFKISISLFFGLLSALTARAAFMAAYVNYDNATEYLVYAHMARGPKEALAQIEELSRRTTDGLAMTVAFDDETTYPYWWYLRNYPNQKYYGANPTRELRDAPVILVGDDNFAKIEPIVGQAYYQYEYIRIWWPNQDYFNLTFERIKNAITNREMRNAIFDIWLNRDYTKYGELTGQDMSLPNWSPSNRMRLYVRKDIANKVWNLGASPVTDEMLPSDPYEGKQISLAPDIVIGGPEQSELQLLSPRNFALAPDGSLYIADTGNHRIVHISQIGEVITSWGTFADSANGDAPPGTFYEPWGIAIDEDGNVYVADTWNHRIQKFDSNGNFITMWGYFGQGETGTAFWGPRDIAISPSGYLFITDTGNKRVVIFDKQGNYISEFGEAGVLEGQFDEPVGLAFDTAGNLYIADTWNQRVQVFTPDETGLSFTFNHQWDIAGWYGSSLDNKPYLTVSPNNHVIISDPEGYRILVFTTEGEFVHYWGDYGTDLMGLNLPIGVKADAENGVWVADSGNNRILHFPSPTETEEK